MARFTLRNLSDKDHLIEFKMNPTDEGWLGYDSEITKGNVSLSNDERLLSVCLSHYKGPDIPCVGATEEVTFSRFFTENEESFKGSLYINGDEYKTNGDGLLEFLASSFNHLLRLEHFEGSLRIRNRLSQNLKVAIKFANASDLEGIKFDTEQLNTTYHIDYDNNMIMFCLSKPMQYNINWPSQIFTNQEYQIYVEISNAPSSLQKGDLQISYDNVESVHYLNELIEYSNTTGGSYSFHFSPVSMGDVSFNIYYKGRLLENKKYTIKEAPKLNLTLVGLQEYNLKDTKFQPVCTMSDGSPINSVSFDFKTIRNDFPNYANYPVLEKNYSNEIVCKFPGKGQVRAYAYHSNTGLYIYSDWVDVNIFFANFTKYSVSDSVGLDLLEPHTFKIALDGIDYLPEGWTMNLESTGSADHKAYFTSNITYVKGLINVNIVPIQTANRGLFGIRVVLKDPSGTFRSASYLNLYIYSFAGDLAAYVLPTNNQNVVNIKGVVFTYEDINKVTVSKLTTFGSYTTLSTFEVPLTQDVKFKLFNFNVNLSDWATNAVPGLKIEAEKPDGSTFERTLRVSPCEPLIIKCTRGASMTLTNSESISSFSRVLVEYEDGSLSYPTNRHGTRSFVFDETFESPTPILKLYDEAEYTFRMNGQFQLRDTDTGSRCLTEIISFGSGHLKSSPSFYKCYGLIKVPDKIPVKWTDTGNLFQDCISLNDSNIAKWDMRNITYAGLMFYGATAFSVDLSKWCVPKLTSYPNGFDGYTSMTTNMRPKWGTCPLG